MFVAALELLGTLIAILAVAVVGLLAVGVAGFAMVLVYATAAALFEESIGFYRKHFGIEGEYRRTREMLDEQGKQYFDAAMKELQVEGVEHGGELELEEVKPFADDGGDW